MQRARSAGAKQQRRDSILKAALARFRDADFDRITMADVARSVRLAKGTLYLYFRTKEELFLALLEQQFESWFDEVDAGLATGTGRLPASTVADLFIGSLTTRPHLRRLLALLGSVLERNLEHDRALRFKWRFAGRLTTTGSQLERRTVFLRPGDGVRVLQQLLALLTGLQLQAEPAPIVRRIVEAPGMEPLRVDFDREFGSGTRALLTGLERTN